MEIHLDSTKINTKFHSDYFQLYDENFDIVLYGKHFKLHNKVVDDECTVKLYRVIKTYNKSFGNYSYSRKKHTRKM